MRGTDTDTETRPRIPVWTLGDRIRKAREAAGLKQSDLAVFVFKSRTTVAGWENDTHTPSVLELREIARTTNVPVEWLTESDGSGPVQPWTIDPDSPWITDFPGDARFWQLMGSETISL